MGAGVTQSSLPHTPLGKQWVPFPYRSADRLDHGQCAVGQKAFSSATSVTPTSKTCLFKSDNSKQANLCCHFKPGPAGRIAWRCPQKANVLHGEGSGCCRELGT